MVTWYNEILIVVLLKDGFNLPPRLPYPSFGKNVSPLSLPQLVKKHLPFWLFFEVVAMIPRKRRFFTVLSEIHPISVWVHPTNPIDPDIIKLLLLLMVVTVVVVLVFSLKISGCACSTSSRRRSSSSSSPVKSSRGDKLGCYNERSIQRQQKRRCIT